MHTQTYVEQCTSSQRRDTRYRVQISRGFRCTGNETVSRVVRHKLQLLLSAYTTTITIKTRNQRWPQCVERARGGLTSSDRAVAANARPLPHGDRIPQINIEPYTRRATISLRAPRTPVTAIIITLLHRYHRCEARVCGRFVRCKTMINKDRKSLAAVIGWNR